jgi:hypothetical protein
VILLAGWEGVRLNRSRIRDLRRVFEQAGVDPYAVRFFTEDDPRWLRRDQLTKAEVEALRAEQEREFGMLACNMRGHLYKKTEWRDRVKNPGEDLVAGPEDPV